MTTTTSPVSARTAFSTGMVAGLLAALVMLLLGVLWGAPIPPQIIADHLTRLIPLDLFARVLGSLESAAKPLAFAGVVVGQMVLGGALAVLAGALVRRGARVWALFLGLLVLVWALLGLVIAPLGGLGLLGRDAASGVGTTALAFLAAAFVYAGLVGLGLSDAAGGSRVAFDPGRRHWLRVATFGLPAVLAGLYLARFGVRLAQQSAAAPASASSGVLPSPITPTRNFYVVSKNFVDPTVSTADWHLTVDGLVDRPLTLTYDELRARPSVRKITTLECISNPVGGDYISTGEWTGISYRELLAEVGAHPETVKVVMHAADGYADSVSLAVAMHPDTMLVYDLNGEPLPKEHGFPLRAIIPGIFGMKNVKWIERIELVNHNFQGFWQERGWSDVATVLTMSRIDVPADGRDIVAGQQTLVAGIAFAGNRGISRVEVSTDGGTNWAEATIEPPPSPLTWVLWTYPWTPGQVGKATLVVRAWDGQDRPQATLEQPPLPNGATGLHRIEVRVVPPSTATPTA